MRRVVLPALDGMPAVVEEAFLILSQAVVMLIVR